MEIEGSLLAIKPLPTHRGRIRRCQIIDRKGEASATPETVGVIERRGPLPSLVEKYGRICGSQIPGILIYRIAITRREGDILVSAD